MFGKLKKDEKKELEELRQKEIARLEEDIHIIKNCVNVTAKAVEINKSRTESYLMKLFERIEKLEDKEIDKEIDEEVNRMYH